VYTGGKHIGDTANESNVSVNYDYSKAYGGLGHASLQSSAGATGAHSEAFSATSESRQGKTDAGSLVSDDASFEKQYKDQELRVEVRAPPGKLGVVIDTPYGSSPIVHAIKDSSVLADELRIGDRLVSVDGEDTSNMSAIKVSRLIASKRFAEVRTLVFLRTSTGSSIE